MGGKDCFQLVERSRSVEQGAVAVVGQRGGVEHLAEGGVGWTPWRLGAGDAADDAQQSIERIDGALGVHRISSEFLDAKLSRAAVQRNGGRPANAGDEVAFRRDGKLQAK